MRRPRRLLTCSVLVVAAGMGSSPITPTRLDATGATFAISFDTYSVDLSLDPAASVTLDVDGTAWPIDAWTGAGPGGHHREDELRFNPRGPASGTARLTLSGLPEPVEPAGP